MALTTTNSNTELNEAWFDKYKPKKIEDLVVHTEHIKKITEWLDNFEIVKKEVSTFNATKAAKNTKTKPSLKINSSEIQTKVRTLEKVQSNILDTIVSETRNDIDNMLDKQNDSSDEEYNEYEDDKLEEKDTDDLQVVTNEDCFDNEEKKTKPTAKINPRAKKNKHYANMLIKGKHGIGKTVTVTVLLESLGYEIHKLNLLNILDKVSKKDSNDGDSVSVHQKKLEKYLLKITSSNNIMSGMYNDKINNTDTRTNTKKKTKNINNSETSNDANRIRCKLNKKFVVVVDELEIVTSTNEKKIITDLLKVNNEQMHCPIILISNEKHNKLVNNVENLSLLIYFSIPTTTQLNEILLRIFTYNKMRTCREAVKMIIEHSQSDIRRLILIAQGLHYAYGNEVITTKKMEKYLVMTCKKETDPSLYEAAEALIYDYKNIFSSLRYYNAEKVMLPLMIHYNYINYVLDKYPKMQDQFSVVLEVSNSLCQGDIISNYIYNDQQWDLQRIYGIYSCVEPSYLLNVNDFNKCQYFPKHIYQSSFSTDLHKTSAKKQNIKKMIKLNKDMDNININDCIYINKLMDESIKNNTIEKFVSMLKEDYDIKYEHIDSIYKIDKLFVNKKPFDVKTQKKIKVVTQETEPTKQKLSNYAREAKPGNDKKTATTTKSRATTTKSATSTTKSTTATTNSTGATTNSTGATKSNTKSNNSKSNDITKSINCKKSSSAVNKSRKANNKEMIDNLES